MVETWVNGPSLPVVGVAVAKVRCNSEGALFSVWVSGVDSEDDDEGDDATYGETIRAPYTLFTPFPSRLLHPLQESLGTPAPIRTIIVAQP
jgi:hypothetical protein